MLTTSGKKGTALHVMLTGSSHWQQAYFDTKSSFFTFRCINCLSEGFLPHIYFLSPLRHGFLPHREQNMLTFFVRSQNNSSRSWSRAISLLLLPLESHMGWFKGSRLQSHVKQNWSIPPVKAHRKRQRRARTVCRSSKIIWHESGAGLKWKQCKEAGQAACIPCRQGTEEGCSLICGYNLSWHSDNKAKEKRVTLALQFPFFFCRWQTLKFSHCFYAPPCVIIANICRTCSDSVWPPSELSPP